MTRGTILKLTQSKALEDLPVITALYDTRSNIVWANRAYRVATGLSLQAIEGRKCYSVWGLDKPCRNCPAVNAIQTGEPTEGELTPYNQDHWPESQVSWLAKASPLKDDDGSIVGVIEIAFNITEVKRSEDEIRRNAARLKAIVEILQYRSQNLQDFLDHALDKAIVLTQSKIGYIYFYDEDRREFVLNTWSKDVMKECTVLNPQTRYELDKTGIWGEAVRQRRPIVVNDFQTEHPQEKGYPEGHVRLTRFLTTPIFHQKRTVAVVGVANKSSDYDETDTLELSLLMEAVWKSVEAIKSEAALRRIEWLLTRNLSADAEPYMPPYGDLTTLNTGGLIHHTVGTQMLTDVVSDYLDLMESSAAIYEKNGDYALRIFSSAWCRFMDAASRRLCGTEDNREALACGKWLCHESCRTNASKVAIESGQPADITCEGSLRIYALPIRANGEIVGSINFSYGDPPRDPDKLKELTARYEVNEDDLRRQAGAYRPRPPFIIEVAKKRLAASARLIGEIIEHKRAEEALRESERRYRELVEHANSAIIRWKPDSTLTFLNEYAQTLFGYRPDEIIGKNVSILVPERESTGADLTQLVQDIVDHPERYVNNINENICRDGRRLWMAWTNKLIQDENGHVVENLGIGTDITDLKRAEDALRKSEEFQRAIIAASPLAIMRLAPDGRLQSWNAAAERIFGWTAEEVLDRVPPFVPENQHEISLALRNQVLGGEVLSQIELTRQRKDGTLIEVGLSIAPIREDTGEVTAVMAVFADITERKRAEDALRESEGKFRSLFRDHAAVKLIIDPENGNIVDANESAALFYGWPMDDLRRMKISQINTLPPLRLEQEMEKARSLKNTVFEFKHRKANGSIVDVEVFSSKVHIGGKEYLHSIIHDITEKRQLENQLFQAMKMESIGRLAGGVAHDINNMLSVILGYTELAMNNLDTSAPLYANLKEIRNAGRRSAEITRQLLAFARKQTISPRLLDLNETVEGMLKMLRRLIGEDIDLAWLPGSGIWPVMVDPSQVDQILANLCVNARDAIAGVGKVIIETGNVRFDAAYCDLHAGFVAGEFILLAVSDNGCGMDKETIDHVFEPFFTTKGIGQGTGLGLATVYGIIKQNNGFINVYSEPGKGTTFKIYLPRHADKVGLSEKHGETEIQMGRNETVLIVEDDISILNLVKTMLADLDYALLGATTPSRAVDLAQNHRGKIHLLLTDVIMPEMNGHDLATRLQTFYPDLKVLYMSGYTANVIAHREVLETGVLFIQKPFTIRDLAHKVREALEQD